MFLKYLLGVLGRFLGFPSKAGLWKLSSKDVDPSPAWEVVGWPLLEMSLRYCLHSSRPGGAELLNARDSSWLTGWPPPAGSSWLHVCCLGCGSKCLSDEARKRTEQPLGERGCSDSFPSLLTGGKGGPCTCAEPNSRNCKHGLEGSAALPVWMGRA